MKLSRTIRSVGLPILASLSLVAILASPAAAQFPLPGDRGLGDSRATVSVKVTPATAKPGDTVKLEVTVTLEPGYHTYDVEQPEEKSFATKITVDASDSLKPKGGWTVSPDPELKYEPVLKKKINTHNESPTWTREFIVSADAAAGKIKLSGKIVFQVCDEKGCQQVSEKFAPTVEVKGKEGGPGAADSSEPADDSTAPPIRAATQRPDSATATDNAASDGTSSGANSADAISKADGKSGKAKVVPVTSQAQVTSVWKALLFGFFAGMILNIMPCVLPVISLKIYGFTKQAGQDRRRVQLLGLAFGAGIVFVFLILAALAAFLHQSWGQHFQSDTFLVVMIALMVLFALGMFDVYTISLPGFVSNVEAASAKQEGLIGSFGKGIMATLLSTPCSGPLLGATTSYAISQPAPIIFAIYAMMGIGMAFPYVALSLKPAWMKKLPKPGEWMNTFKEATAFMMLGTAVWLLWQRIDNGQFVVWTVSFCIFTSFAAWIYGRWSTPLSSVAKRWAAPAIAAGIIAGGAYFSFVVMWTKEVDWEPYSQDRLLELQAEGKTVVVDWTARW